MSNAKELQIYKYHADEVNPGCLGFWLLSGGKKKPERALLSHAGSTVFVYAGLFDL